MAASPDRLYEQPGCHGAEQEVIPKRVDWIGGLSRVKSQAPNPKFQRTPNSQLPNRGEIWKFEVGRALGFGLGPWDSALGK
jgi:hypothetical protein